MRIGVPAKFAILGSVGGFARPVLSPVSGVAYTEVCFSAFAKTSRSCHTASLTWVRERGTNGERNVWGDGTFHVRRLKDGIGGKWGQA
ncbi:hypothetical protein [Desulfosporosinus sp. BICA1-9]|uniref:hypothetical protein n=1 Tax=Desulfosporosinus sp. BICA1-9 TaxID=1531958 RepID=UPI0025BC67CD|nr:hypothetical protein [Desulfosporosinus sp. BICA1-9]